MMRLALSTAIALVVGLYLGHRLADGAREPLSDDRATVWERSPDGKFPKVAHTPERQTPSTMLTAADVQLLKRELASVVTDLVQVASSGAVVQGATDAAQTAESMAADQHLREAVDAALAVGRWTNEDSEAARAFMAQASAHAVREAMTAVVAAVNEQRLQLETNGPPF